MAASGLLKEASSIIPLFRLLMAGKPDSSLREAKAAQAFLMRRLAFRPNAHECPFNLRRAVPATSAEKLTPLSAQEYCGLGAGAPCPLDIRPLVGQTEWGLLTKL